MAHIDIFRDNAFSLASLTAALNVQPEGQAVPSTLDSMFDEDGVSTLTVSIERENGKLALVPDSPRGSPGQTTEKDRRDLIPFNTLHLPLRDTIYADEIQGVRAFGTESELEVMRGIVNKRTVKLRSRINATLAYHRLGAVTGKIFDADGQRVLLDLYDRFGYTQKTVNLALGTATTKVRQKVLDAKRQAEDALAGAVQIKGWLGIMGRALYDAFTGHDSVEKAFDRWKDGEFLRADMRKGFIFEDVEWKEYYGKVGAVTFLDPNEGYLVPIVTEDLFQTRFAPANHIDVVNTPGLPFYASQEILQHGMGVDLKVQSNPLTINTRPNAVIRLRAS